jgi:hypothetical protein
LWPQPSQPTSGIEVAKRARLKRPDLKTVPGSSFKFLLVGNIPSKKNRVRFGSNGVYHDANFSRWHKQAMAQLMPRVPKGGWIAKTKRVEIFFVFESRRVKDLTNAAESIMDLLVDCGILKDDNFTICKRVVLSARYIKGVSKTKVKICV